MCVCVFINTFCIIVSGTTECGQYYFINIGCVSRFQWHPFTVSSAADSRYLTMHVKNYLGNEWTHKVHNLATKMMDENVLQENLPQINVDGPYGTSLDIDGNVIVFVCAFFLITCFLCTFYRLPTNYFDCWWNWCDSSNVNIYDIFK